MLVFKEFMAEPTELEFLLNEWMENNADCDYEIVNIQEHLLLLINKLKRM